MFKKLRNIISGWFRYFVPNVAIEKLSKLRLEKCDSCEINVDGWCSTPLGGCGCPLAKKTRSVNDECPINLW